MVPSSSHSSAQFPALLVLWNAFVIGSLPTVLDQAEQVGD